MTTTTQPRPNHSRQPETARWAPTARHGGDTNTLASAHEATTPERRTGHGSTGARRPAQALSVFSHHLRYGYAHASASDALAVAAQPTGRAGRINGCSTVCGDIAGRMRDHRYGPTMAAPVVVGGRLVAGTQRREPLPEGVEQRPNHVTELVALARASAQARRELAASRARLVEAADAERRRLERDLHDGAQQRFVALSLTLRLAQARLTSDPKGAAALLAEAGQQLQQGLDELRELARGLRPAVLSDRGLRPALQALAARAPFPVELEAPDERFPSTFEVAVYFLVSEALTNAAKYAAAGVVRVTVTRRGDRLVAQVADDGSGGADPAAGSGLRGLRDRVEALGGRLAISSPPGRGTVVRAELPLR